MRLLNYYQYTLSAIKSGCSLELFPFAEEMEDYVEEIRKYFSEVKDIQHVLQIVCQG